MYSSSHSITNANDVFKLHKLKWSISQVCFWITAISPPHLHWETSYIEDMCWSGAALHKMLEVICLLHDNCDSIQLSVTWIQCFIIFFYMFWKIPCEWFKLSHDEVVYIFDNLNELFLSGCCEYPVCRSWGIWVKNLHTNLCFEKTWLYTRGSW